MKTYIRAIKLASINKKLTYLTVLLTLIQTGIEAGIPQIIKRFFDLVETHFRTGVNILLEDIFWYYLGIFTVLVFSADAVGQTKNFYINKWWMKTKRAVSTRVFGHLQKLSVRYFEVTGAGELKQRIDRGIDDMNEILQGSFMEILPQALFIIVALFFLFRINPIFGLTIFIGIPLFVLISLRFTKKIITVQDQLRNSEEKSSGIAMESILNVRTVKSFATERKHLKDYSNQLDETVGLTEKYMKTRIGMNVFRFIIINTSRVIILGVGSYWALSGRITIGTLALAWAYTERSFGPMWHLTWLIDNMQRDLRSVRRVFEILDTKPSDPDLPGAKTLNVKEGKIKLENIHFGYEDRKVIDGLNLEIPAKRVVAFVGRSGAGKSTLIKLILRFNLLQRGRIVIDNQNIEGVTQESLRNNIGVVLQETALFNDTVYNNIAYARRTATKEEVLRAARIAHADEFIKKLEKGYETKVGESGIRLSGGEKQRISIARAVLKDAPILILDEATSALDSESEAYIQDALWHMVKGKTAIIIAHRLSTIMKADLIVVMDKGKIIEMDTHKELIKNRGLYAKLYEIQAGGLLG